MSRSEMNGISGMNKTSVDKKLSPEREKTRNAPESPKTEKARKKLEERFKLFQSQLTPKALQKAKEAIFDRIDRLALLRVPVKKTLIGRLFDGNKTSAPSSAKVKSIADKISISGLVVKESLATPKNLKGRVEVEK